MTKVINFDMDGTIANLYGVNGWLDYIIAEDVTPYAVADPLLNMNSLARVLNRLIRNGWEVNIISWTAKHGTADYNARVEQAKREWLSKHLASVEFANIFVVPYGTPKYTLADGILFDDEIGNRNAWGCGAYDVNNIIEILKALS